MIRYVLNRFVASVIVLFILSVLIFFTGHGLVAGSAASTLAGANASAETIAKIEHELGLDRPLTTQYIDWLSSAVKGDLGTSPLTGLTTIEVLKQQIPVSLELAILSVLVAVIIGVPLGVISARRAGTLVDSGIRIPMIIVFAIPGFITGTIAVILATSFLTNLYSPTYIRFSASALGNLQTMILPALAVGIPTAPLIMQMTRASMIETLNQPFIAAARVNGIRERRITYGYALRAALPPVVTFVGFTFGMLVGGLLVVEQIFSLPGLGRGILNSIGSRDFVLLNAQAIVLAGAFITANFIVDLVVPALDRRIARR